MQKSVANIVQCWKPKNYVFITQTIRLPKNFLAQKINKFM